MEYDRNQLFAKNIRENIANGTLPEALQSDLDTFHDKVLDAIEAEEWINACVEISEMLTALNALGEGMAAIAVDTYGEAGVKRRVMEMNANKYRSN